MFLCNLPILRVEKKMAGSNPGGYECEFVDPVKDFECPLCLHVTRDPNLTSCCGQHFCQVCINRIQTNHQPCPFCKDTNFTVLLDKKQNRKVLELKVYCTMKEQGCSWTGELGGLSRHLEDCQYITISCTKGCGVSFQRHCLAAHIAKVCPKRDFTCQYCSFKSTYEEVCNKHWPECAKYPLPCPNKCNIAEIQRGSLKQHLNKCPLQQVECEFYHAGCKEKIKRKDLTEHMEKSLQKHLSRLSTHVKSLSTEAAKKDEEIRHLQSRVQNLENVALVSPVEFTMYGYNQYEGKGKHWEDGPTFYTYPMGHKVKIVLWFSLSLWHVRAKLRSVEGKFDDQLQWPLHCTLSIQLLDQWGEQHLERSSKLQIERGKKLDLHFSAIRYDEIRNPTNGAQYLKENSLHFRVDVKLK